MRTITTSKGVSIELDGDVLAVLEGLFKTLWDGTGDGSFEDTAKEIQHVLGQFTDEECRKYLSEVMFLSFTRYENDRIYGVLKKLDTTEP